jgi:hypothetical protein
LSASGAKRKGGAVLGRRGRQAGPLGPFARAREKEKAAGLGLVHGLKKNVGPAGKKREGEGEGGEKDFLFLFKISFQIHFSNIQTSIKQKSMHSNHDAQTLIISKLF